MSIESSLQLGPFQVQTSAEVVRAFAASISPSGRRVVPNGAIPHTFPFRWLTTGEVRDGIQSRCGYRVVVAVNQAITYHRALLLDATYGMRLTLREMPGKAVDLWLNGHVVDANGRLALEMKTGLLFASGLSQ